MTSELSMLHLIECIEKELMVFIANEYLQFTRSKMVGVQCFFTPDVMNKISNLREIDRYSNRYSSRLEK
jgi:hypothetical protein